jgi:TonB family protein
MNRLLFGLSALLWTCTVLFAQDSQPQLTIAKLHTPIYPPMAVVARVGGEVRLRVKLNPDGSASAVTVESGPPMLRQAAADSATRSRFEASPENASGNYLLIYRFDLDLTRKCDGVRDSSYLRVKYAENIVNVAEQPVPICDPSAEIEKVRSAKCLYLWRCGSKVE